MTWLWVLTYESSFVKSWVRNCAIFCSLHGTGEPKSRTFRPQVKHTYENVDEKTALHMWGYRILASDWQTNHHAIKLSSTDASIRLTRCDLDRHTSSLWVRQTHKTWVMTESESDGQIGMPESCCSLHGLSSTETSVIWFGMHIGGLARTLFNMAGTCRQHHGVI